jgi:transcriptional regulator with XRE-family HTH domain
MQPSSGARQGLGARLRELRVQRGLSVRTLAAQVGFSPSFISQVEADAASPSISSLEKIATALGVTLGQLFTSLEHHAAARTVIRRAERSTYTSLWSQATLSVLTDSAPERTLGAIELMIEPQGMSSKRLDARPYDSFALVLAGAVTLVLEAEETLLDPGDSAYVPADTPFAWVNRGELPATLLMVGTSGRVDLVQDALSRASSDTPPPDDI